MFKIYQAVEEVEASASFLPRVARDRTPAAFAASAVAAVAAVEAAVVAVRAAPVPAEALRCRCLSPCRDHLAYCVLRRLTLKIICIFKYGSNNINISE